MRDEAMFCAKPELSTNVLVVTLGCAKNLVDSEVILGALEERGYRAVSDPMSADLIVVNTCGFLQSAVEEGIDRILELAEYKTKGRCRKLVVCGCMVERYREKLVAELPEVDRFVSTDEILSVGEDWATTRECLDPARRPCFLYDEAMPRHVSTRGGSLFVKVADGCDWPCSFCIIPKLRGEFRSRPVASVVREVGDFLDRGGREINLVAQDITAYGSDWEESRGAGKLIELLRALSGLREKSYWLRLLYGYPVGVTPELVDLIRDLPHICRYLDLPLQHISDTVLRRMKRPLGEAGTRALIEMIRSRAPEIALRTTLLVGFPGETEEDIRVLEDFVAEGHFAHLGVFPYSAEDEAESSAFLGQVSEELKQERVARIMQGQKTVVEKRLTRFVGEEMPILVEGLHHESNMLLVGRSEWQAPETDGEVIINDVGEGLEIFGMGSTVLSATELADRLSGQFGVVQVTGTADYDLVGKLVSFGEGRKTASS